MMRFCALACAALLGVFEATPARACTAPAVGLIPYGWYAQDEGVTPTLASGSVLLLMAACYEAGCPEETWSAKILDDRGGEVPAVLEEVDLARGTFRPQLLGMRPKSPLATGVYTLQTSYQWRTFSREQSFPFRIAGMVSNTSSTKFNVRVAENVDDQRVPAGTELACDVVVQTSCGPRIDPPVHTQQRPMMAISAQPARSVPESDRHQYLFRLVATGASASVEPTEWQALYAGALTLTFGDLRLPKYCVELQALRVRDSKIQSLGQFCFSYAVSEAREPAYFKLCQEDPTEYVRAYCADNAAICSATNPHAKKPSVQAACAGYADVCAPLIGNRTARDRPACQ